MKSNALGLVSGIALCASAGAGTLDEIVGNKLVILEDGREVKVYFKNNREYTVSSPDGDSKGTWTADGDKLCLDASDDSEPANCEELAKGKKVGDSWTQVNEFGSTVFLRIEAGE